MISARPLTSAEKYYAFLDAVSPMNLMMVAELDRSLPIDFVAHRWSQFVRLRSLPRLRVCGDLTLIDGGHAEQDFAGEEMPSAGWDRRLGQESGRPFGLDRPMRLRYVSSPDEGRSRLVVTGHHALFDGRIGIADLQAFIRLLDGQAVPEQQSLPLARPPSRSLPWQVDRKVLLTTLRALAARHDAAGPPEPTSWPQPIADRQPHFHSLTLAPDDAADLLAGARTHGSRAYSALAAAWLIAAAGLITSSPTPTLQLATPVDLAAQTAARAGQSRRRSVWSPTATG